MYLLIKLFIWKRKKISLYKYLLGNKISKVIFNFESKRRRSYAYMYVEKKYIENVILVAFLICV